MRGAGNPTYPPTAAVRADLWISPGDILGADDARGPAGRYDRGPVAATLTNGSPRFAHQSEAELAKANQHLRSTYENTLLALVAALDARDHDTEGHSQRVAGYAVKIGETMGLSRERIRQIESRAKEKMRRSREAQGLRGYLN